MNPPSNPSAEEGSCKIVGIFGSSANEIIGNKATNIDNNTIIIIFI